jgi:hypothetical protein
MRGGIASGELPGSAPGGSATGVSVDGPLQAGHLGTSQAAPAVVGPGLGDGVQAGRVGVTVGVLGQACLGAQRDVRVRRSPAAPVTSMAVTAPSRAVIGFTVKITNGPVPAPRTWASAPGPAAKPLRGTPAGKARGAAPDTRPAKIAASAFPLVRVLHGNGLRSRERRFESCRGTGRSLNSNLTSDFPQSIAHLIHGIYLDNVLVGPRHGRPLRD